MHMMRLSMKRHIVCEKSDGMRFLLAETNDGSLYKIDRRNLIREVFVSQIQSSSKNSAYLKIENLLDGELVID